MELKITNKKGIIFTVYYDDEDHPLISKHKWYIGVLKNGYKSVRTTIEGKKVLMSRLITGVKYFYQKVDHKDHDTLNNRKDNLRVCTSSQNNQNRINKGNQKYKGVCWDKNKRKWNVAIKKGDKVLNIGKYDDEELAARIYDVAAKMYHGEFANLNFK